MLKDYLFYRIRSKKFLFVFLIIIQALALVTGLFTEHGNKSTVAMCLGLGFAILMICAYVLPPLNLSYLHNKKSIDTYLSLPYSRKELLLSDTIFTLLLCIVPWAIFSVPLIFVGVFIAKANLLVALGYIISALLIAITLILLNSYLYLLAHSIFDGIVMIGAYLVAPLLIFGAMNLFQSYYVAGFVPIGVEHVGWLSPPFVAGIYFFEWMSFIVNLGMDNMFHYYPMINVAIYLLVIIVITTVLLFRSFEKRDVEKAESASDHFLAYPFLIYFYTFILLFIMTSAFDFIDLLYDGELFPIILSYSILFVFFVVAHFVYRRRIYINAKMVIFFLVTVVAVNAFIFGASLTHGYGLSYRYNLDYENVYYQYNFGSHDQSYFAEMGLDVDQMYDYYIEEAKRLDYHFECYENRECFYFDVNVVSKIKHQDLKDAKHAIDFYETLRLEAIDDFYSHNENYSAHSNLYIGEGFDEKDLPEIYFWECDKSYSYRFKRHRILTMEELESIEDYAEITLTFGDLIFSFEEMKNLKLQ